MSELWAHVDVNHGPHPYQRCDNWFRHLYQGCCAARWRLLHICGTRLLTERLEFSCKSSPRSNLLASRDGIGFTRCENVSVSFPDLRSVPELPQHRVNHMTVRQVLSQASGALHAAEDAAHHLERSDAAHHQFALLRQVAIECRRSTFLLQKLSSRVEGWEEWYEPRQDAMRADPLMAYFANSAHRSKRKAFQLSWRSWSTLRLAR